MSKEKDTPVETTEEAVEEVTEKLEDIVVNDELVETEEPLVDLEDTYEKEEAPSEEDKKILEFCLECSWVTEAPIGRVFCPACGGRVIRQRRGLMKEARNQNRFKRGV